MKSNTSATVMITPTSSRVAFMGPALAVLNHYVLQRVGDVFAVIGGLLEQVVNFFQLDQTNAVFLVAEQIADGVAADLIGHLFEPVYFDALRQQGLAAAERLKRLFQRLRAVGHDAVRRFLDAVENVIQVRRQRVDVFGIERSNEGLVQADVDVVDDLVALLFEHVDLGRRGGELRVPFLRALQQQQRGFDDDSGLIQEKLIELLVAGQQSHASSVYKPHGQGPRRARIKSRSMSLV